MTYNNSIQNSQETKTGTLSRPAMFGLMAVLVSLSGQLNAQSRVTEFVPFNSFQESIKAEDPETSRQLTRPGNKVREARAFGAMRQHILGMYDGVAVKHSFVRDSSHFDCIPVEQQPAVRALGLNSIAAAPPQSMLDKAAGSSEDAAEVQATPASQLSENSFDAFGNAMGCAEQTVPVRRITLEEMTQFPTLQNFLNKIPDAAAMAPKASEAPAGAGSDLGEIAPAAAAAAHKYAYMTQTVNNLGGNSTLNLWRPYVNTALGEVFSLSQQWYVGGSGTGLQTVEVGWQNYPTKYGSQDSRLFIYYTPDNYKTGCYNLDCAAFVQIANTGTLGGGFSAYSTKGGQQYEVSAKFYLFKGNWWLAIQGTWIGYYPGSIFKGGQLTKYAERIEFGTESVGTTVFPAEGSGDWATAGRNAAAYQRDLYYFNTSGTPIWTTLSGRDPSPKCYSTAGPFTSTTSGWNVFFYAGGPGGSGC